MIRYLHGGATHWASYSHAFATSGMRTCEASSVYDGGRLAACGYLAIEVGGPVIRSAGLDRGW